MPKIPVFNTRDTISTDVPRMAARPANDKTSGALASLGDTVSRIGAVVAQKRQAKIDATAELDFDLNTSKAADDFITANKDKIDDNGQVDGVDFKDALSSHLENTITGLQENSKSVSSDQLFKLDQKAQIKKSVVESKGLMIQNRVVADRMDTKANQTASDIIDSAYKGDLQTTSSSLKSWDNFLANLPAEVKNKWEQQNISEKAYSASIEGMINKGALSTAKEAMGSLGGKLNERTKIKLNSKIEQAQRLSDRQLTSEIQDNVSQLNDALKVGVISSDEAAVELDKITAKASRVSDPELVKGYQDKANLLAATIEVSDGFDTLPVSEWQGKIDEAVSSIATNSELGTRINSAVLKNNLDGMVKRRIELVNKNAADYFLTTDKKAKDLFNTASTPEGFASFSSYVKGKAKDFNVSSNDLKIVPSPIVGRYKGLVESSDPALAMNGINQLKQLMGSDFSRGILEVSNNPQIIAAANIADESKAMIYLQDARNPDFKKAFEDFKFRTGIEGKLIGDYKSKLRSALNDGEVGKFLEGLSVMPDGGKSLSTFQNAMETAFQAELMRTNGNYEAADNAVKSMFLGDNGKFEVVENTTGENSIIILPKDNKYRVTGDMVSIAIDKFKASPYMFAARMGIGKEIANDFVSEGSFKDSTFRINQSGDGLDMYVSGIKAPGRTIPLSEVEAISVTEVPEYNITLNPFLILPKLEKNLETSIYERALASARNTNVLGPETGAAVEKQYQQNRGGAFEDKARKSVLKNVRGN